MNPYLTPKKQPRVNLNVFLSSWIELDFLIDTGFSGGIAIPESFKSYIKQQPLGFQEYELADGSRVIFGIHITKVKYNNKSKTVNCLFTKSDDALVGIEFLEGFSLILDLKKFKVSLE